MHTIQDKSAPAKFREPQSARTMFNEGREKPPIYKLPGKTRPNWAHKPNAKTTTAMAVSTAVEVTPLRAVCSGCGTKASCNCNAPYVPAHVFATIVIAKNPDKSNRAIAELSGVALETIRRARAAGDPNGSTEKRIGKDGKKYSTTQPSTKPAKSSSNASVNTPESIVEEFRGRGSRRVSVHEALHDVLSDIEVSLDMNLHVIEPHIHAIESSKAIEYKQCAEKCARQLLSLAKLLNQRVRP